MDYQRTAKKIFYLLKTLCLESRDFISLYWIHLKMVPNKECIQKLTKFASQAEGISHGHCYLELRILGISESRLPRVKT